MTMLPAYDVRTGRKLPHYVPEHWFDHPVWGKTVRRTPRSSGGSSEQAPATGDNPTKEK